MTTGNFALNVQRFVEKAKGNANIVVRKLGIEMTKRIIQRSPVDTGRFRGNWVVSINAPAVNLDASVTDPTGETTLARETAKLATFEVGPSIFITNSLPYAKRLEYGWSKQAPTGMVHITVLEMQQMINKAVGELK